MASDHTDRGLGKAWYKALQGENCVQFGKLLLDDSELLKVGWKEDIKTPVRFKPPRGWKTRTALHIAARRGDLRLGEQIRKIMYSSSPHVSMDSKELGGISSTDFKLLEVIDSDYELDVLAMAVVSGNQTIVTSLKRTSLHCIWNPYDIGHENEENEAPQSYATVEDKISNPAADVLRVITSNSLSAITAEIQQLNDDNCDFNFLERDLYFFHFTFSTWTMDEGLQDPIRSIQKTIFSEAKANGHLDALLSKLKDGQGRTALHVAVDSQRVKEFLRVIKPDKDGKQLDPAFLDVADSAGRTPLYRAAAKTFLVRWRH